MNFTPSDLDAFARFRAVQAAGSLNMASARVRDVADLTRAQHTMCLEHYAALAAALTEQEDE